MRYKPGFQIERVFENDDIIIYKRLFDLKNHDGGEALRYFKVLKYFDNVRDGYQQFRSITQVKKFIKSL